MSYVWNFPLAQHGNKQGSGGDITEPFESEPLNNLVREIIQNSLDARDDFKKPVVLEFHKFIADADDLPAVGDLGKYIFELNNEVKNSEDEKDKAKVKSFVRGINGKRYCFLRISDFNTTGLWGSSDPGDQKTPWFAFIKGTGQNQKGKMSGGSKGMGKGAIFVNSLIRTMLVSTTSYNPKKDTLEKAWTGIARLMSKTDLEDKSADPDYTQGVGYCVCDDKDSKSHNYPVKGSLQIDPEFERKEKGTDIYIPCFGNEDYWADVMALEAIKSFMPAFLDGDIQIVFSSDDTSVKRIIGSQESIKRELIGKDKERKETKQIFDVLTSKNTKVFKYTDKPGYEMELHLLQHSLDGLNSVFEYRLPTKMLIRSEAKNSTVDYTGVLLISGEEIATRLKNVEDATHRKWSKALAKYTNYSYSDISEALTTLDNFVSDQCLNFGTSAEQVSEYFDVVGWQSEDNIYDMSVGESKEYGLPTEEIVFNTKEDVRKNPSRTRIKRKGNRIDDSGSAMAQVEDVGNPGEGENELSHPVGHNNGTGGEMRGGSGSGNYDPNNPKKLVIGKRHISTTRAIMPAISPDDGVFSLIFRPEATGTNVEIEIFKSGVGGECEDTKILSASMNNKIMSIKKNRILMDKIEKDKKYQIDLTLDETKNYVWEINVYAEE